MKKIKKIEKEIIGDLWSSHECYDNLVTICNFGNRFGGTKGEIQTRDFIIKKMRQYGFDDVSLECFEYTGWKRGKATLQILKPNEKIIDTIALPYCPSTPQGGLEGDVIYVGDGTPEDFKLNKDKIKGKIVLVTSKLPLEHGRQVHRRMKYGYSVKLGAKAFIFMNNRPGMLVRSGSLRQNQVGEIPGITISYEEGMAIRRFQKRGTVRVRINTSNEVKSAVSCIIAGEILGSKYPDEIILVGAHYDAHDISQGAMDNGSGVVAIMELARIIAPFKGLFKRTIRFVFFPVEELACTGSGYYVHSHEQEHDNINLMICLDNIAHPGNRRFTFQGFGELVSYFMKFENDFAYPVAMSAKTAFGSDHAMFALMGVPTLSVKSAHDSYSFGDRGFGHTIGDTIDKVDETELKNTVMVVVQALLRISNEDEAPARRKTEEEVIELLKSNELVKVLKLVKRWELFFPWKSDIWKQYWRSARDRPIL